jgi:hypothetical protein
MPENPFPYVGRRVLEYRCVYCARARMFDLGDLKQHEDKCELKKLRQADWKKDYARVSQ